VTVVDADEGDDDNTGTLIVALLQKERRSGGGAPGSELLTIGYNIYQVTCAASLINEKRLLLITCAAE